MPKKTKPPTKTEPPTGRAAVPVLMVKARELAASGQCVTFNDVIKLMGGDGVSLKLWAGATERDEIDRLCAKARAPMRRR